MQELRWKLILVAALGAVFAFLALTQPMNLGLDLRGGIYLELNVDVDEAVTATVQDDLEGIGRQLADEGITAPETAYMGNSAVMTASNDSDAVRLTELLGEFYPNTYSARRSGNEVSVEMQALAEDAERDGAINQALQIIRNRVDQYGVAEPVIQRLGLGGTQILVQLPGVENPERIKSLLRNTALLELKLVQAGPLATRQAILDSRGGELPPGTEILQMDPAEGTGFYLVDSVPLITGRDLKTAGLGQDDIGLPAVSFTLSTEGSRKFSDATGANVGRQMAIVLDDRVRTAPTIEERISTPQAIIRGQYSVQEAQDLGLVLRSGALPASIEYLSERFVGPSLGQESIDQGVLAAVLGLAIVAAFMVLYYKGAGINALVALGLNMIIVIGVMNALGAALTLPGIAGMILLVGMAVDANVLIFERIREELDLGKTVRSSVDAGFNKAFSAIIDANVTTLVAAIFLFQFGTGPVKGFAVTLSIGIMASMFTAIFVSRALFDLWILRRSQTLSI
ncbi:MAG: protein translocase subunit SecD [Acidobacteria bacterium]|nr:protein translocase subunit SecD [Acidobacteriota bacterium]